MFIESERNEHGVRFGDNSMCLEMLGVIIPFISNPDLCRNKRIVIKVDNIAVYFGIVNRNQKSDKSTAVLIRALYLITSYLECEIFVDHLPRVSNWESSMVDRMSRRSSTSPKDDALLRSFKYPKLPRCLIDWFASPKTSWNMAIELLEFVEKCSK
jgi:hypothetical protein